MMPKPKRLLIVLADGEHARFLVYGPDHVLRADAALDAIAAHKRSAELGSDRPGASFHSDSSARHALSPRHDLHALEKEKFAGTVSERLNRAAAEDAFDALLLVAPAHMLTTIRKELSRPTAARLVGAVEKDLVKIPVDELAPHLAPWVRAADRAAP